MANIKGFLRTFQVAVNSSATAVRLTASSLLVSQFSVLAFQTNSGAIVVGDSTVNLNNGFRLTANSSISLGEMNDRNGAPFIDLSDIYVRGSADANGICIAYIQR